MEELTPFIGEWTIETSFSDEIKGRSVFEWLLDGHFMVQRSEVPHPAAPDGFTIVGPNPEGGYTQHYFDSRGVVRVYAMRFDGKTWELERTSPDFTPLDFSQRFEASFGDDGRTIEGAWYSAKDGSSWELDFHLTYRRVA